MWPPQATDFGEKGRGGNCLACLLLQDFLFWLSKQDDFSTVTYWPYAFIDLIIYKWNE